MHRFFLNNNSLGQSEIEIFDEEFVFQITKVLRFRENESLILFNGTGNDYVYKILGLSKKSVRVLFEKSLVNIALAKRNIRLYMSMTKQMEKFEFVLQKCTEIGVSEFFPLISQRTERRLLDKKDRLFRILREATEQCGADKIPFLHDEVSLQDEFLKERKDVFSIFAHLKGESFNSEIIKNIQNIDLFIGPEGGFSDSEYDLAISSGLNCFSFGKRVLRAETAAISISSLINLS